MGIERDMLLLILIIGIVFGVVIFHEHNMMEKCTESIVNGKIIDRWMEHHHSGKSSHDHYFTTFLVDGTNETLDDKDLMLDRHIGDFVQVHKWTYIENGIKKVYKVRYID